MDCKSEFITVSRGCFDKCGDKPKTMAYNGIMYRLSFRSDQPLWLAGVSFFGPNCERCNTKKKEADYLCYLELTVSHRLYLRLDKLPVLMKEKKFIVKNQNAEKFMVNFSTPVEIPSKTWIDIAFQLEGPATHMLPEKEIDKLSISDDKRIITLDMSRGSRQISDLHFLNV